ncbi:hypothetical protein JVU11DRAFT_458 [Chiua virens]|nr:hypothetical protein JVU11DRAFT_458 [Chiua virens]
MQSHSCAGLDIGKDNVKKHEAARVLLAEKFLAPGAQMSHSPVVARQLTKKSLPTDPRKLAQLQRVNLMKLRHKAVPGDPKDRNSVVPVDQRLHVVVQAEIVGQSGKEVVMWFRKVMWVHIKVSFSNTP